MEYLTAEELLAGSAITHDIEVPPEMIAQQGEGDPKGAVKVKLRPLTVRDIQRVTKAAKESNTLLSVLMLKEALVEPKLTFEQVHNLPAGLARFLLNEVNQVSGLTVEDNGLEAAVQAPLARACFILAREFGWSPKEVGDLTMAQILLYMEMIREERGEATGT